LLHRISSIWYRIVGGIIMAPFIGILIGRLSSPLPNKPQWAQIAGSLFYLYVAAACFAIGMALFWRPLDLRRQRCRGGS
jgi:hypothetical protein